MNNYHISTHIYTDGSKAKNLVAAAYTIPALNLDKQIRLCNSSSIYAAELTAMKEVFSWISENENQDLKDFVVFSDSLFLRLLRIPFQGLDQTYCRKHFKPLIKLRLVKYF